jgi:hypothetical protein
MKHCLLLYESELCAIKTRTAWAVFKYCGTKTVTIRMKKKYEKINL